MSEFQRETTLGALRTEDGCFDHQAWRRVVSESASVLGAQAEALTPFGFELTGDPRWLRRDLRRFYVYLSVPQSFSDRQFAAECFVAELMERLSQSHPAFAASLVAVVVGRSWCSLNADGSRIVYVRPLNIEGSLLDAWARYLIAAVPATLQGLIRERKDFDWSMSSRRYLFQVSYTYHYLLKSGRIAPDALETLEAQVSNNAIVPRTTEERWLHVPPTVADRYALHGIVLPQFRSVEQTMRTPSFDGDKRVPIHVMDFHGSGLLEASLSERRVEMLAERITTAYLSYDRKPH